MDFLERERDVVIIMEYCDGGTLNHFVEQHSSFFAERQDIFLRTARQMLQGLLALHEKTLVHRDIKPENVFLVSDESAPKDFPFRVVLGDLGLAKQLNSASQVAVSAVGTDMYKPPEHLQDFGYSQLGDVWQLGLVFRFMLTGKAPFDPGSLPKCIVERRFLQALPNSVGRDVAGLVDEMTQKDPSERPTCKKLLENPLFGEAPPKARSGSSFVVVSLTQWWDG